MRLPAGLATHLPGLLKRYLLAPILLGALLMFLVFKVVLPGTPGAAVQPAAKKVPPALKPQLTAETPLQAQMETYRLRDSEQEKHLKVLAQQVDGLRKQLDESEQARKREHAHTGEQDARRRAEFERLLAQHRQQEARKPVVPAAPPPKRHPEAVSAPLASLFELRTMRPERTSTRPLPPLANYDETAYLAIGCHAEVRMATGVMASSQLGGEHFGNPILFTITGTFHCPWKLGEPGMRPVPSGIDAAGCLGLGKAKADLASSRAQIMVEHLSCILPDGTAYEPPVKGFIVDRDGTQGLVGQVYTHDSAKIGKAFVAGMIQEASAAFGLAKSHILITDRGLSGQFPGQASTSTLQQIANYWLEQARALQPTLWVHAGSTGFLVLQQGLPLHGYPVTALVKGIL